MDRDELINKYRPKGFDEVIGNTTLVHSLQTVIAKKRSKTFLFTGPAGIGKTTLARLSANAAAADGHADLLEFDAATKTGIDDMRQICNGLFYQPLMPGAVKALILDEVHALSKQAWQSLLKMLEEPPSWVYWFLCTTDNSKVPDTVKTRCARYDLKPVPKKTLTDFLDHIADKEKFKATEEVIDLCVREANGSPRQALANLTIVADLKDRKTAAELLRSADMGTEASDLARALLRGAKLPELVGIVGRMSGQDQESVRRTVRAWLEKVALGDNGGDIEIILALMEQFAIPYAANEGMASLLGSIYRASQI